MADLKLADGHGGERIVPNTEVGRFTGKFNGEVLRPTDPIQQERERASARSFFSSTTTIRSYRPFTLTEIPALFRTPTQVNASAASAASFCNAAALCYKSWKKHSQ